MGSKSSRRNLFENRHCLICQLLFAEKNQPWWVWSEMAAWEGPEVATSRDTPALRLHVEPVLLKKKRKPAERLLHSEGKRGHVEMGEAETWSCQKPPRPAWWPTIQKDLASLELLPEERGVRAPHRAPQTRDLNQRDEALNCLAVKTNGAVGI